MYKRQVWLCVTNVRLFVGEEDDCPDDQYPIQKVFGANEVIKLANLILGVEAEERFQEDDNEPDPDGEET